MKQFTIKSPDSADKIVDAVDIIEALKSQFMVDGKFNREFDMCAVHMNNEGTRIVCILPQKMKSILVEEVQIES